MFMFNDIDLDKKVTLALSIRQKIKMYASRFIDKHWVFLDPGEKRKRYQGYAVYCGKWELLSSPFLEEFENSGKVEILSTFMESLTTLIF